MSFNQKKYVSQAEALQKLQRYCAYQDRCHQEVRSKLLDLGIYDDALEEVIIDLITDNFLNEERFACSYARGKFRIKKWGRNRIIRELKQRNISAYCLKKALQEIEEEVYLKTLTEVLQKKKATTKAKNEFECNRKIAYYAIQKGYESELVWEIVKILE